MSENSWVNVAISRCQEAQGCLDIGNKSAPYRSEENKLRAGYAQRSLMSLRSEWDQDILWKLQSLDQFKSARLRIPHESHAGTYSNGEKEYYRCSTWLDLYHQVDNFGSSLYFGKVLKKAGNNATSFRIWVTAAGVGLGLYSSYAKAELTHEAYLSYERDIPPTYKCLEEPKTSSHKQFTDHDQFLYGRNGNINKYFAKWYSSGFDSNEHFEQELMNTWGALGPVLAQHPGFDRTRLSINQGSGPYLHGPVQQLHGALTSW